MTEKKSLDKANGLELYLIKSKVEPLSINNLEHALSLFNSTGYAVAYLDYKVLIGKVNNNGFEFFNNEKIEEKYIQKLRLFNDDKELLIWRDNNGLKGRLRIDGEGEETFAVDACQLLWGTKKDKLGNGWIKLFEDRGTELILPYDEGVIIDNKRSRLFIMTRNYISFHPGTNQATYFDCRFIKFTNKQAE
jgi:CRISPR-associated protein (TIGR03984 family)